MGGVAHRRGIHAPFRGRRSELDRVVATLDECVAEGRSRCVVVVAPEGLGKTRFADEIAALLAGHRAAPLVWRAGGEPLAPDTPLGLASRVVRVVLGLGRWSVQAGVEELASRLPEGVLEREQHATFLAEVAGAQMDADASPVLEAAREDPRLLGDHLRRAFAELFEAASRRTPLVLLLDDVQWADAASMRLFGGVLRQRRDSPFVLVALGEASMFERLGNPGPDLDVVLLELPPLAAEDMDAIVDEIAPDLGDAERNSIAQAGAGSPLELIERVRARQGGPVLVTGSLDELVTQSYAELPSDARDALAAAAVFGVELPSIWLATSFDRTVPATTLSTLVERDWLVPVTATPGPFPHMFRFRHALHARVVRGLLDAEEARKLHVASATMLESMGTAELGLLAYHAERGERPEAAARAYKALARRGIAGHDFKDAARFARAGLALPEVGALKGGLQLVVAEALHWQGDERGALKHALSAMGLLRPGEARWLGAAALAAESAGQLDELATLRAIFDDIEANEEESESEGRWLSAWLTAADALRQTGQGSDADRVLARATEALEQGRISDPRVLGKIHSAQASRALNQSNLSAFLRHTRAVAEQLDAIGDARGASAALINEGYGLIRAGQAEEAATKLREVRRAVDILQLDRYFAAAEQNLGLALLRVGKYDDAIEVLRTSRDALERQGDVRLEAVSRTYLAEALLARGDAHAALLESERALELTHNRPPNRMLALATRARILLTRGDVAGASASASEAHEILRQMPEVIDSGAIATRLVYLEVLIAADDVEAAREVAASALESLLDAAMRIEDAHIREQYLAEVPENARTLALATEILEGADAD